MTVAIGTRLGPYEILAPINTSNMGEVYRARDSRLSRHVALKVLPSEVATDPDRLRRFEIEARATGALNHPGILSIFDFGDADGIRYVITEFLEGETLRDRLGSTGLTISRSLECAAEVAQALAAAHDKGIVHRDIKPENLFILKDGRVKVLDFGLAKVGHPEATTSDTVTRPECTDPGTVVGTVGYMSPEQVRGQTVDGRSDIFSLGAVLYEMLGRQRAFRRDTGAETMTAILREDPPALRELSPAVSEAVARVVGKCLQKRADERFQSAQDLAFVLSAVSASMPNHPPPIDGTREGRSLSRRSFLPILLGGAGLAGGYLAGRTSLTKAAPSFRSLTFRRGKVWNARFAKDGQTIVYGAAWEGAPMELFATRADGPESRPLGLPGYDILSISSTSEMALVRDAVRGTGTLWSGTVARVPLGGGSPRDVAEEAADADWSADGQNLAIIRWQSGKMRLEYPVGTLLYESDGILAMPRVSSDGKSIAFAEYASIDANNGDVAVVDLQKRRRVLYKDAFWLRGLAWNDAEVWFTCYADRGSTALHAVMPSGRHREVARFGSWSQLSDVSKDGRTLLLGGSFRRHILGRDSSADRERDLSWFDASYASDISADGRKILLNETLGGGGPNMSIYLRAFDGSASVKLGEGEAHRIAPDGKWVLALSPNRTEFLLIPTGAGEIRRLPCPSSSILGLTWLPEGARFVFAGRTADGPRLFLQSIEGTPAKRLENEEDLLFPVASPDGTQVAVATSERELALVSLAGGPVRPLGDDATEELPIQWSPDGRYLYAHNPWKLPLRIFRIDVASGQRQLWKQTAPADLVGVDGQIDFLMTRDASAYAYSFRRLLSELVLAENLR